MSNEEILKVLKEVKETLDKALDVDETDAEESMDMFYSASEKIDELVEELETNINN